MPFSVMDFLNIPIMKQAKVHTSAGALSSRPAESISVIEIPVENFIRKNELVVTTAMGCNKDTEIFKAFVQDIFASDAAALVIATGGHVTDIPGEVLALAEKLNFPIIEIPWEIRFADIIEAVLSELHNWHQSNLKRYQDLQKRLLNLFLNGSDLSDAAELIHRKFKSPVVIINNAGEIKGKSRQAESLLQLLSPHLEKFFSPPKEDKIDQIFHVPEESIGIFKIESAKKLHGYLLLKKMPKNISDTFWQEKENMMVHVITTIALWFQKEQAVHETEMRLRDDFVWSMAKGEFDSWETLSSRAKSLGYNLSLPYICIVGSAENTEKLYKDKKLIDPSYEQWLCHVTNHVKEQIIGAGKQLDLATILTYQQDLFIIFLEITNKPIEQTVNKFLDLTDHKIGKILPDLRMFWGIGENHVGVNTFHDSFTDAKIALDFCCRQNGQVRRSTYANTGVYRAILTLANSPEVQEIALLTIGALVQYEKNCGLDLINTFKAYIQNQGNVSQTARSLNLHRQSLIYRLKKIESLTNRSLSNTDDIFLLDLCVRVWTTGVIPFNKSG